MVSTVIALSALLLCVLELLIGKLLCALGTFNRKTVFLHGQTLFPFGCMTLVVQ